jgi:two-component system chemotaxis sensor kinase CheA
MQIDEDVKEFLIEGYEHLNQIEGDLLVLEQSNSDPEVMNRIYRSLHTIKGNSGFLGLDKLEGVTHAGENLLSRLRDRTITLTPSITDALLQVVDAIKHHFQALETTSSESDAEFTALLDRLNKLQESESVGEKDAEISTDPPLPPLLQGGAGGDHRIPPCPPLHKGGWNVQNWQLLLKLILINLALPIRRSELMLRF